MALDGPRSRLEVPDAVVTLVLGFGSPLRVRGVARCGAAGEKDEPTVSRSLLAGLSVKARVGTHDGHVHGVEVLLQPWAAFRLFGVAMHEVADTVAEPDVVLGPRAGQLGDALAALSGWSERFALLDTVLTDWGAAGPTCSPRVVWAWNQLRRTAGTIPIRRLTEQTGWSWRQLNNRFREQIGLSPKAVARVLRLRRTLRLLADDCPLADTAARCGFSDQAHLGREFKNMTGVTPRRFLLLRAASPAPAAAAVDRIPGEVTSVLLRT
ncbi:helix-turn-helix domain-containing protein [Streptomyces macrosporus]|uniref:AraC family transcriptional regulator n=1 Tax=Streptomyces macrosporus TaxID=44032 RepID=UPI0031D37C26